MEDTAHLKLPVPEAPPIPAESRTRRALNHLYQWELYALLSPYLVGALILVLFPALLSFALAFTEYDALAAPTWNGIQNFRDLATDRLLRIAMRNSLYFIVLAVPLRLLAALGLALFLNQARRGIGVYRAAVYLPTVIPDMAYALIWLWIFNPFYG